MYKDKLILIGYSGHAYVIADVALSQNFELIGYIDVEKKINNPYDIEYLGTDLKLYQNKSETTPYFFVAIGANAIRKKILDELIFNFNSNLVPTLISKFSKLTSQFEIGIGTFIGANAIINPLAQIGKGCIINTGAIIEHECTIGEYSHVAPGVVLAGNVQVGSLSFIGANSVVKQGVKIGNNVIIGAGSVILKDVQDGVTIVGNPGKIIKRN
jgi:sugar O-acyltransferase (sialic acid O-acetyltransferase NeuD family)